MNELIFFLHLLIVIIFTFASLRLGKEALVVWLVLQSVMANVFVLKQTVLFSLQVTCSDVYAVGSFITLNLMQEFFEVRLAKRAIWIAVLSQSAFLIMSQMHILYMPGPDDFSQNAFTTILQFYPRILTASIIVFFVVQQMDVKVFQVLKTMIPNVAFVWRNLLGLILSQIVDTLLFSLLALWGIVYSLGDVIIMALAIKGLLIALSVPFTSLVKYFKPYPVEP